MTHPIRTRRLYARDDVDKTGDFVIVAEPRDADVDALMTDALRVERREAERRAIDAEWARIRRLVTP